MPTFAAGQPSDAFVSYVLGLIGDYVGTSFELAPENAADPVDVLYGNVDARPCRLRIPHVPAYSAGDIPLAGPPEPGDPVEPFPFDAFSALRFWLADEANAGADQDAFDARGRLVAAHSAQGRLGLTETPIVNLYLLGLRRWLEVRLGLAARRLPPPGKRCVVVLSHDVDLPLDPHDPSQDLVLTARAVARGVRPVRAVRHAARTLARAGRDAVTRAGRHWVFEEVVEEETRRGFSSVFFFAATTRYDERGTVEDVAYDVGSPRFRRLLSLLTERGAEVGLHIGYRGGEDPSQIAAEKRHLEEAAGRPVLGSRHHFLMPEPFWAALEAHERAGLLYDASVCFNEAPGYRLGVALPFRPWNPQRQRSIGTVQIPTFTQDLAFLRDGGSADAAVERMYELISGLKAAEGVAALDWHEYTSFPASKRYGHWGRAYLGVLDLLASDSEVAVMSAREAARLAVGPPPG